MAVVVLYEHDHVGHGSTLEPFRGAAPPAAATRPASTGANRRGAVRSTRLADVLVVQAIRAWLDTAPAARAGWLAALRDARLGNALAALWREPARDGTVAELAKAAALSRSAFAARFLELVGEPPVQHLTRVRMLVARDALANERASLADVAERAGYRSEAAFSRAFKRVTGVSPGRVRRGTAGSG